MVNIKFENPPNIEAILIAGMKPQMDRVIFAYDDTLYIPGKFSPSEEIIVHEEVHLEQQKAYEGGPSAWWEEYIKNPIFRLQQEIEAYHEQYNWIRKTYKDGNLRHRSLHEMARLLSSQTYGHMVKYSTAYRLIQHKR